MMYYFLNNRLDANSSGIEHAEVKRLKLFKQKGVPAKIVTCEYNRLAHRNLPLYEMTDDDYVNMFDFFAGTVTFPAKVVTVSDLSIPDEYQIREVDKGYEVYDGNRKTMRITMFPNGSVDTIDYFNGDGNHTKQDFYDTRGFKSMTQMYDTADGHLIYEQFSRPNNTVYYETSYEKRPNSYPATNIQLTDTHGKMHSLMNTGQAFTIMLDELNEQDGDEISTFISDRSNCSNVPMINMKTPARKIEHFHNIHFRDFGDPNSPITYPSISNNELLSKTDLVITPSQRQADDMTRRLRTQVPIVSIPVGIVPDEQLNTRHIPMSERMPGKIVAAARLFYEKRLDDAINAFAKVYRENPMLSFDIYGYGNGRDGLKEEKMLRQLVKKLGLENVVQFKGYTQDMETVYNTAELLVLSSRYEGAPLAIVEAQSHGVPVIAYDINYGPADLIQDGQSGFLVPSGNVNDLAAKIEEYFASPELMEKLNEGAYESAKRFSSDNVWKYWEKYVINA
ncbi:glycosyltransferase [Lactobacillus apis]|uniref:glycosyltransferase n=1 Tax=Lactobacillus apis TaxID=303541 RepID=UPI00243230DF|nr:glycosyltransferase [Lactobacillus apis]